MDTLIPVVIILAVVCFLGYKNREKLSALYDRIQNDHLDDEPEVSTIKPEIVTPYKVEPNGLKIQDDGTTTRWVSAPVSQPLTIGSNPQTQEEWTAWRNSQAPSTRAYIPEKFTPGHTASGEAIDPPAAELKASPMPKVIPDTYTKYTVNLKAGQLYSLKMAVTNKNPNRSVGLTPTTSDPARLGASYFIKLIGAAGEIPYKSRPGNAFKQFRNLAPGDYTVEITSDKDSQVFAHFK